VAGNSNLCQLNDRLLIQADAGNGQDRDLILLAEALRSLGDGLRGPACSHTRAVKAEQLAILSTGFDNVIGEQSELLALGQMEGGFGVRSFGAET
jgi:hypothetical protein